MSEPLLSVQDVSKRFPVGKSLLGRPTGYVHAVNDVSFDVMPGETFSLVGESGCGKSTTSRLIDHLITPDEGRIFFDGDEVTALSERQMRPLRAKMQMVFQDPYASLNPRMTVRNIIAEPLVTYKVCATKEETTEKVLELMKAVGVPAEFLNRYPHQFSGGQRQRIGIARAIALNPQLVVCDEPVSALDVSVQSQVLNLLKDLQAARGLTYLFISHDLSVVNFIADRVCVMFLGKICEIAPKEELYEKPLHPYTRFLLDAIPLADPHVRGKEKMVLQGEIPSPVNPPSGCRFHTRCPYATELCATQEPELRSVGDRQVACHHVGVV